jgi:hypothetical protein
MNLDFAQFKNLPGGILCLPNHPIKMCINTYMLYMCKLKIRNLILNLLRTIYERTFKVHKHELYICKLIIRSLSNFNSQMRVILCLSKHKFKVCTNTYMLQCSMKIWNMLILRSGIFIFTFEHQRDILILLYEGDSVLLSILSPHYRYDLNWLLWRS